MHIHLDLDVLDPLVFPHVSAVASSGSIPAPRQDELLNYLAFLSKSFRGNIVGLTLTEFAPRAISPELEWCALNEEEACQLIGTLLGQQGLDLRGQWEAAQ